MAKCESERAEIARLRQALVDVAAFAADKFIVSDSEFADYEKWSIELSRMVRHNLDGHSDVPIEECIQCLKEEEKK